jgi:hypothetical protein
MKDMGSPTQKGTRDVRYLLVRRAGRPERNYYELTRTARFLEPQLYNDELISRFKPSRRNYGFDVETETTVRYGVYQAWKVRVIGTSDSQVARASTKVSAYVLIYPRNPDWVFCARKYGSKLEQPKMSPRRIVQLSRLSITIMPFRHLIRRDL